MLDSTFWLAVWNWSKQNPSLVFPVILVIWLAFAWWHRLIVIGWRTQLSNVILGSFLFPKEHENSQSLALAHARPILQLTPQPPTALSATPISPQSEVVWTLGDVYRIHWTFEAKAGVVRYTSWLTAFLAFAIGVMHLAQPSESVDLGNIVAIFNVVAVIPLGMLATLTFSLVHAEAHKLPCPALLSYKPTSILLLAW